MGHVSEDELDRAGTRVGAHVQDHPSPKRMGKVGGGREPRTPPQPQAVRTHHTRRDSEGNRKGPPDNPKVRQDHLRKVEVHVNSPAMAPEAHPGLCHGGHSTFLKGTLKTSEPSSYPTSPCPLHPNIHQVFMDTRGSEILALQDLETSKMDI